MIPAEEGVSSRAKLVLLIALLALLSTISVIRYNEYTTAKRYIEMVKNISVMLPPPIIGTRLTITVDDWTNRWVIVETRNTGTWVVE
jgi:hypothetical protein